MEKIDVFAHVLLPKYYNKMLEINSDIFAGRIDNIVKNQKDYFKKFYVELKIGGGVL